MEQAPDTPESPRAPPPLGPSPEVKEVLYRAVALGIVIIAGIILILAGAVFLLSVLTAPAAPAPAPAVLTTVTTAVPATVALPSTTAPVEQLPGNLEVRVSVDAKSLAGLVTVNFNGGAGKGQVKEIIARLTLPDGSVETGSMDPQTVSPQIVLKGSRGTDHLEVFAHMYSGKVYKILEQDVLYPVRN